MKNLLIGAVATSFLIVILVLTWRSQRVLTSGTSYAVHSDYATAGEAFAGAAKLAPTFGAINSVLGTGSMAPIIPPSAPGKDPLTTIVAYVVVDRLFPFDKIEPGMLVTYRPAWAAPAHPRVTHIAAQKDGLGWIMAGLNNRHYENRERVTRANYVNIVTSIHTWKQ